MTGDHPQLTTRCVLHLAIRTDMCVRNDACCLFVDDTRSRHVLRGVERSRERTPSRDVNLRTVRF